MNSGHFAIIGTAYSLDTDGLGKAQSCHMREIELCAVGALSLVQSPTGLPVTEPEIKRQCGYLNETTACFESYIDLCFNENGMLKPLVDMFAGDLITLKNEFCDVNSEFHKNYTKHAKCFRSIQTKHQQECMQDFQVGFEGIHKVSIGQRLSTTCCNINRLKECVLGRVEQKCGSEAVDLITMLIERVASNVIWNTCRAYDPFEEPCQKLLPKTGTKPHNGRNTSSISRAIAALSNPPMSSRSGLYDDDDSRQ